MGRCRDATRYLVLFTSVAVVIGGVAEDFKSARAVGQRELVARVHPAVVVGRQRGGSTQPFAQRALRLDADDRLNLGVVPRTGACDDVDRLDFGRFQTGQFLLIPHQPVVDIHLGGAFGKDRDGSIVAHIDARQLLQHVVGRAGLPQQRMFHVDGHASFGHLVQLLASPYLHGLQVEGRRFEPNRADILARA